jgi:hypothetical protein
MPFPYTLSPDGNEIRVAAGQQCFIPRGTRIAGKVSAGTRTVHAFGGRRAVRAGKAPSTPSCRA